MNRSGTLVELMIPGRKNDLGGGLEVSRLLPFRKRRMVGPFIFFDHMGPVQLNAGIPRTLDVRPHPHIGLSTLTYLFSGEIMHRDSVGVVQPVLPGEVNWMTAGRGITHSERFERARAEGDFLDGIQTWIALPDGEEEIDPSFHHLEGKDDLPLWTEGGVITRLIAGEAFGMRAAVPVRSPLYYMHLEFLPDAVAHIPATYPENALYVAQGAVAIGGRRIDTGMMAVLEPGETQIEAAFGPARVMVLGGEPVGERFIFWNFVSSSADRIEQAKSDWRAGRMKLPDADDQEFIPLPADRPGSSPGRSDGTPEPTPM